MKSWILIALLVPLACQSLPSGHAQAQPAGGRAVPDRALMQGINDAWSTLNPDNAARYYDRSPGDVFFDVAPLQYTGWAAYARGAREMLATLQSMKYTVGDDAVVHMSGDLAWGTAILRLETLDKEGLAQAADLRWTVVWEKKGDDWLIVHEHLSAPTEQPQ